MNVLILPVRATQGDRSVRRDASAEQHADRSLRRIETCRVRPGSPVAKTSGPKGWHQPREEDPPPLAACGERKSRCCRTT